MSNTSWEPNTSNNAELAKFLVLWHNYRASVLGAATCLLLAIWLYLQLNQRKEKSPSSPKLELGKTALLELNSEEEKISLPKPKETSNGPRRIKGELRKPDSAKPAVERDHERQVQVLVFFSSLTGTTEKTTKEVAQILETSLLGQGSENSQIFLKPQVLDLTEVDYDEFFISAPKPAETNSQVDYFYLLLLPSYNIDTINDTFLEHLKETHNDFRIDSASLSGLLGYSVFGLGDREGWPSEEDGFCFQAKEVDKWLAKLTGRKRAYPLGMGDPKQDLKERLVEWTEGVTDVVRHIAKTGSLGEGVRGSGDAVESDDEYVSGEDDDGEVLIDESALPKKTKQKSTRDLEDLEDLGKIMKESQADKTDSKGPTPIAIDFTTYGKASSSSSSKKAAPQTVAAAATAVVKKEMVPKSSPTHAALTKQGYTIVGSHSGVKICRWTKSALRGRGSCYKYSFYGIHSHQCMETTPSLSCSNKCVFCWRHGTNPVGTTWRWVVDPPDLIFAGVKAGHYQKMRMMRGVPGVRAERFAEAMRIRHCALSLVGEPIFYPHIDAFLALLHGERISSFLVCNAQHPDQLAALGPVTQLYVSIDASSRESLRRIDRPLHRDFWERFQRCLDILRERRLRQRTVFRLTLVKGFNVEDEVDGYAGLVERGLPCFVEIKGVTYCGTSSSTGGGSKDGGGGLTMANVPFYSEIVAFVEALHAKLGERGLRYGIAAEHAHSCCVLLASDRFRVGGRWHTRIDYDRFFELLEERGPRGEWAPEEYMGEATPEWAAWGQGGFDPRDERVDRKGRKKVVEI